MSTEAIPETPAAAVRPAEPAPFVLPQSVPATLGNARLLVGGALKIALRHLNDQAAEPDYDHLGRGLHAGVDAVNLLNQSLHALEAMEEGWYDYVPLTAGRRR